LPRLDFRLRQRVVEAERLIESPHWSIVASKSDALSRRAVSTKAKCDGAACVQNDGVDLDLHKGRALTVIVPVKQPEKKQEQKEAVHCFVISMHQARK
jgi:hypothetical protein